MSTLNPCIDPFEDECPKVVRVMTPGPPGPQGNFNHGFSQELSVLPFDIAGAYGGVWKCGDRFFSQDSDIFNGSRATAAFMRFVAGSGINGPATSDYALHIETQKLDFLNSQLQGEIDGANIVIRQGELGDSSALVINAKKVHSDLYGQTAVESKLDWLEPSTGEIVRSFKAVLGGNLGGTDLRAAGYGVLIRCDVGQVANGIAIFNNGGIGFTRVFQAATGLADINRFFEITGGAHPDGRGLMRAFDGSPTHPSLSFINLPDAGFWKSFQNTFSAGVSGTVVTRWVANHFIVGPQVETWIPGTSTGQTGLSLGYGGTLVLSVDGASGGEWQRLNSDGQLHQFYRDTAQVGNISVTATATAYNTSSDGRAKTHVETLRDVDKIFDALRAVRFDWIKTGEPSVGFIAQEVEEIIPGAASQDEQGNWFLDRSFAVPYLWAQIQNLTRRLDQYEARRPDA